MIKCTNAIFQGTNYMNVQTVIDRQTDKRTYIQTVKQAGRETGRETYCKAILRSARHIYRPALNAHIRDARHRDSTTVLRTTEI